MILAVEKADGRITIPVQHFVPGIYTLEVVTANEVIIRKIIKTAY